MSLLKGFGIILIYDYFLAIERANIAHFMHVYYAIIDGKTLLADGPFFATGEYIAAIDVVSCADQEQAIQLAATHPAARSHPIEVRPFENQ